MDSPSSDVSVSLERPIVEEESRTATQKNRRATVGRHANSSNNITPLQSLDDEFETVLSFKTNPWQTWIPSGFWAGACIAAAGIVLSVSPIERSWYVAATLLIFSIAFALRARSEVYTFDPNTHFFTLQKRALWGSSVMTVSFNEIKEVKLEESTDTQGGTEVELLLVLSSGQTIPIMTGYLCGLPNTEKRRAYKQIAQLLQKSVPSPIMKNGH